jgi:hypothetical protein
MYSRTKHNIRHDKKKPREGIHRYKRSVPAVTLFSRKQQHSKHAHICLATQHQKQIVIFIYVHAHSPSLIQQIKIKTIRNTYHFRTIIIVIQNYSVHH